MSITLNGKKQELAAPTSVANFLLSFSLPAKGIAVAINNEVIPREQWEHTQIADGNEILLIQAFSGG
ncbi:MAG: sulfur carrier protein ThiS [Bacteroidales bacterium]|jgi:sulfur carrier protein|nr:sulfur carrier protein ThiS [Bacteroidales bacterium]